MITPQQLKILLLKRRKLKKKQKASSQEDSFELNDKDTCQLN
jgi:hypothetical protein